MNVFEEFPKIAKALDEDEVKYALVGGVAMAFHSEPRFTWDIDILVNQEDLIALEKVLVRCGYFESAEPWTFKNSLLTLHRFAKAMGEDLLIIDVLVGGKARHREIIQNALVAESETSRVRVARKEDLIWMKMIRNSKQDQADIERLRDEENGQGAEKTH
jgi:hypothetical protein